MRINERDLSLDKNLSLLPRRFSQNDKDLHLHLSHSNPGSNYDYEFLMLTVIVLGIFF